MAGHNPLLQIILELMRTPCNRVLDCLHRCGSLSPRGVLTITGGLAPALRFSSPSIFLDCSGFTSVLLFSFYCLLAKNIKELFSQIFRDPSLAEPGELLLLSELAAGKRGLPNLL